MPNPRPRLRPAHLLPLLSLALPALAAAESAPASDDPWRLMAGLRFSEARAAFSTRADASELDRLGRALSLLGAQPRTDANITEAERLLADLAARATDPAVATRAAYLHARVPHIHRPNPDLAEAARRYLAVFQARPDHLLGQRAYVRHGIVTLFRPLPPEDFSMAFQRFIDGAAALDHPDALRDLEWLLVALHERKLQDPAGTLRHLERLLAGPSPIRELTRLGFLVQAGELARELGDTAKAARYYREFLAGTQRDARVYFIRQRLAEMEASS
jgi:tetratricopeptide (TPR) repeat protein